MSISDHCLLMLTLKRQQTQKRGRKCFFFEAMWTRDERCKEIVEVAWEPGWAKAESGIIERIKRCQDHLLKWNWEEFGIVNKVLKQKKERLQQLELWDNLHGKTDEIQKVRKEINEIQVKEEIMWNQRSRALWLKWGDRNKKIFHATASQRHRKNWIAGLQNSEGVWVEDKEGIESTILDYFQDIYKSNQPTNFEASLKSITNRVSPDMNEELLTDFKAEEVWFALKQMHPTKAPRPDGMSPIFFKHYWDIVGPEVVKCVLTALNLGIMPSGLNETHICLIPKVKSPQKITEYRPISLCNVVYKLISKVLANRLKRVLAAVIDDSQSAFVPGRLITDNVLVAFKTMHYIDQRKKGKEALMAIKLDMSKAYDRVEWVYLEAM